ncbi:methyl-accepting chemotaxis protein, partial [Ralstonia pseudosolanacearum]
VLEMLQAMSTGHDGSMGTIHSSSPSATVARPAVRKPAATVRARAPRKPAAEAPVAKAASSPAPAEPAGGKLALSAAVDQDDWTQF